MGSQTCIKLPIIKFSTEHLKPGTSHWDSVCNEVRRAIEEFGCFEAIYDNFTLELHNAVLVVMKALLNLPMETKQQNIFPDKPYYGYLRDLDLDPLYEGMGIYDSLDIQAVQSFIHIMWPEGNPSFCEILHSYTKRVSELEKIVKRMLFQSLGVEKYYNSHVESTYYLLRPLKYEGPKTNEPKLGAATHTDLSFLSILHQNQVNGLEVRSKSGEWISVTSGDPSSFTVMIGDFFFAWSNGRVHCPKHRVMMSGNETRYTIALFSASKEIVECPEELVDEQHPLLFKPFNHTGLLEFVYTEEGQKFESPLKAYCGL